MTPRKFQLFFVQDIDVPMHVVAYDYADAVRRWEAHVRADGGMDDDDEITPPSGVMHVANEMDLLLPKESP